MYPFKQETNNNKINFKNKNLKVREVPNLFFFLFLTLILQSFTGRHLRAWGSDGASCQTIGRILGKIAISKNYILVNKTFINRKVTATGAYGEKFTRLLSTS